MTANFYCSDTGSVFRPNPEPFHEKKGTWIQVFSSLDPTKIHGSGSATFIQKITYLPMYIYAENI